MGWLLATLMACHGLSQTGPSGMKGVVLDVQGYPVVGLRLASIEAEGETDAEGHFSVAYKSDAPYLQFKHLGVWYRRHYQPEDRGKKVRLGLPQTRDVEVRCPKEPLQIEFDWALGEGFGAYLKVDCAPGELREVLGVPSGTPTVAARRSSRVEQTVDFRDQGALWSLEIQSAATVLEVEEAP